MWWRVATLLHRSLTIGGKEHRSGARMNVNPQQLTPRRQQLRVPPCRLAVLRLQRAIDVIQLRDIVHALRTHSATCAEATKCALYIFHNRARMRYPKFRAKGFCTS